MVKKFIRANLQKNTGVLTATAAQPIAGNRSARSSRPKRPALDRGGLDLILMGWAFLIF